MIAFLFEERKKGYRYITTQLARKYQIKRNPKTVLRYMRILGLKSPIRKKKYVHCSQKSVVGKVITIAPNLLKQNFESKRPMQKLVTDVSYLYHKNGRLFLSIIKDLYDNSILAYQLSRFNNVQLVMDNLKQVFTGNHYQCILHSDQGFQYTTQLYKKTLEKLGVSVSHSRKGNCYDNACCENFFSHLKSEQLYLKQAANEVELIEQVEDYITWYNTDRPQEKLKDMTPLEFRVHVS